VDEVLAGGQAAGEACVQELSSLLPALALEPVLPAHAVLDLCRHPPPSARCSHSRLLAHRSLTCSFDQYI
jgi:hypothetical protein